MPRSHLPLNALRAFEAAARHGSFTRAAEELHVTQAAVSHQVKQLEQHLDLSLFRRLPRGLAITPEGEALLPVLHDAFDRMGEVLERLERREVRQSLAVGAVGTFAVGWLLPRLEAFSARHPQIEVRLSTHNNRVDLAAEGLDAAIRFGDGGWPASEAIPVCRAPLSPICTPALAATLARPADLLAHPLLRSYREQEWPQWFAAAGVTRLPPLRTMRFDSSLSMMEAARQGAGIALLPPRMFERALALGEVVQPFPTSLDLGGYWLTWLKSREPSPGLIAFRDWLVETARASG